MGSLWSRSKSAVNSNICCKSFNWAQKVKGIVFFPELTVCQVVSAFRGNSKKAAWQTWNVYLVHKAKVVPTSHQR